MDIKLVIFDMDGTILDTLEDLTDSTNYALKKNGLKERSIDEVRSFVGNGIRKLIERAVGNVREDNNIDGSVDDNIGDDVIDKVFEDFKEYYAKNCAIKTKPYDGIIEIVKELKEKGIYTAVVSNKADFAVQSLCVDYFDNIFDYAVGEKEGIKCKPCPDGVMDVLNRFGIEKENAVYVGDSDVDFMTAKNSGLEFIGVTYGFRTREFLENLGSRNLADSPREILKFILN
ncbi:phosphoglycolate phosphatase [Lachnospiraceae bacterium RM5]|nr:phosphoglycolate phosphatase [Lachnospiraceae bacterium RM5]